MNSCGGEIFRWCVNVEIFMSGFSVVVMVWVLNLFDYWWCFLIGVLLKCLIIVLINCKLLVVGIGVELGVDMKFWC